MSEYQLSQNGFEALISILSKSVYKNNDSNLFKEQCNEIGCASDETLVIQLFLHHWLLFVKYIGQ